VRCFVTLDQLDDLTQNDSIKRLAVPNIVCEVNSISHNVSEYVSHNVSEICLAEKIVSFSQSINQSPNISPNDQHLFAKAVKSTTAKFAPTA